MPRTSQAARTAPRGDGSARQSRTRNRGGRQRDPSAASSRGSGQHGRGGSAPGRRTGRRGTHPRVWLAAAIAAASLVALFIHHLPRAREPLSVTYEIDLARASAGELAVTLLVSGPLPRELDLTFPPGVFDREGGTIWPAVVTAQALDRSGKPGEYLSVEPLEEGWRVSGVPVDGLGFSYRLVLGATEATEEDIRRHISGRTPSGLRAAAFEILVQPAGAPLGAIAVAFRNPERLPLVVPWSGGLAASTEAVPENLLYRPQNRRALTNALIATGRDLRNWTVDLAEARLRVATEQDWLFADADLTALLRRVTAAEIDFFGEAPQPLITCLVVPNGVHGPGRFDIYGAHTGSSLILWLDRGTSYADLVERAASVVAHEMFHGWLGEAIRQREPETLWFTEGATSLYAVRMLVASGVWSPERARRSLDARLARDLFENPRHGEVAIADAAAMVMSDPESVRLGYAGGIAACLALERWLAAQSAVAEPLDALLHYVYAHRDEGHLTRASLEAAILAVTGVDASAWLARHPYGRDPLPDLAPVI